MTLMIFALALPWLFLGLGFWLGYQLLLQNGRMVLRLEALEEQWRRFAAAFEADETQEATTNGSMPKPLRGKANKGLQHSRLIRDGLKAGTQAPNFRLPRLEGGGESALEEFRGRPVLLVFSDPGCGPCEALAPHLEEFHRQNPDLQLLMISRGDVKANRKKVNAWGLTFPIALQRQWEISLLYGMFATPIAYWIDEQGVLAADVAAGVEPIRALMAKATSDGSARQPAESARHSAVRGSPDPAPEPDRRSPEDQGDLRSSLSAGSGDPRRARDARAVAANVSS